jgi:hypothetical protein
MTRHHIITRNRSLAQASITEDLVRRIRSSQEPQKVIAIENKLTEAAVSLIRSGKRWSWVK